MYPWEKKKKPAGWEVIEPTLTEINKKMREAESQSHEGKRRQETIWPIFQIHHQRTRYIWETYKKGEISREVYDFCIKNKIADQNLIAMWKKKGYEKLCCLACAQNSEHNFGTTCICRVPKANLPEGKLVECCHCGCRGCASGDGGKKSRKRDHETEDDEVRKRIANLSSMMEGVEEKEGNDVEEDEDVQDVQEVQEVQGEEVQDDNNNVDDEE